MEVKMKEIPFEFDNFTTVMEICEDALDNSLFMAIKGEPGYGKTYAAIMFCNKFKDQTTYIKFKETTTPSAFFGKIVIETERALGRDISMDALRGKDIDNLSKRAVYNLTHTSGKHLLIVDEAGKLKTKILKYLHELRDDSMGACGLVIMGPDYFQSKLENESSVNGIPELLSRIYDWTSLKKPNKYEKTSMCKGHGISNPMEIESIVSRSVSFRDCYNKIKLLKIRKKRAGTKVAIIAN